MPWQRHVVDIALEYDRSTGRLAYRDVIVTVPRQAGKTTLMMAIMVWRAFHQEGARIVYTAQDGQAARKKWRDDQVPMLERSSIEGYTVRFSNGDESIRWKNGSLHEVLSPTERAGHGKQIDLAVVDEAFSFADHRLDQGLRPAMLTRPEPQFWVISTAGHAESHYLKSKVEAGRQSVRDGLTSGLAFFEWSADPEADPADPETWWSCIPSLGRTVDVDAIALEHRMLAENPAEFERAYLNRWTLQAFASKIPPTAWSSAVSPVSPSTDDCVFSLDVSPNRDWASIAVSDGEVVEIADRRKSADWCVGRVVELWSKYDPVAVVVDQAGPAAALVPDLEAAGVRVEMTNAGDYAGACARFYDAVVNKTARHTGQSDLTTAVAGAATRKLGDRWAWSRSTSAVDISPLVAVTLALWGATTLERESAVAPVFAY